MKRTPAPTAPANATAIYARISLDRVGDSTAPERQVEACTRAARERGLDVVEVFVDRDLSASSGVRRPAYERLKEGLERGDYATVISYKLDRLVRRPREWIDLREAAKAAGGRVVTLADGLDTSTQGGRMTSDILASMAEGEAENLSIRQRAKNVERAKGGLPHGGGRRPFGYVGACGSKCKEAHEHRRAYAEVDEAEAELVREAARRVLSGASLRSVAMDFAARGVLTPSGRPWARASLRQMLLSPALAGLRVHEGETFAGTWEPILDRDTHERLARLLASGERLTTPGPARVSLLTGFAVCGRCGGPLATTRTGTGKRRYACVRRPETASCGRLARMADPVDEHVRDALLAVLRDGSLVAEMARRSERGDEAEALASSIRRDEASLKELDDDYRIEKLIERADYVRSRRLLMARLEESRRDLARLAVRTPGIDLDTLASMTAEAWEASSLEHRRLLVAALVEKVVIHPAPSANAFDPEKVEIVWTA